MQGGIRMKRKIMNTRIGCMMLVMLCGCGDKLTAQTVESVQSQIVDMGLHDPEYAKTESKLGWNQFGALLNNAWVITFCDYGSDKGGCNDEMTLYSVTRDIGTKTEGSNYVIYEVEDDSSYMIVSRVDNTILMLSGKNSEKYDIQNLARTLGYYK